MQKKTAVTMARALNFNDTTNVYPRDYGLEKIVGYQAKGTPYPRLSKSIDMETLRKRLLYQRSNESQNNEDRPQGRSTRMASVDLSETLALGTSHPRQSHSSIESKKQSSQNVSHRHITVPMQLSNYSDQSSYTRHLLSIGTPHPLKKIALNPKTLLTRLNANPKRKVQVVLPRNSIAGRTYSNNSIQDSACGDSINSTNFLSFYERRRLFDMNEFNIAKNGKKLCEIPMPKEVYPVNTDNISKSNDEKALHEIVEFLRAQGTKFNPNNLFSDPLGHFRNSFVSEKSAQSQASEIVESFEYSKTALQKEDKLRNISFN